MAYLTGQSATVTVGGSTFPVASITYTGENDVQKVTTTSSGGNDEFIAGVNSFTVDFEAFYNAAAPQMGSPLNIQNGASATFVIAYAGGSSLTLPTIIKSISVETPASEVVKFSGSAQGTGAPTVP